MPYGMQHGEFKLDFTTAVHDPPAGAAGDGAAPPGAETAPTSYAAFRRIDPVSPLVRALLSSKYTHHFTNLDAFHVWLAAEEHENVFQFCSNSTGKREHGTYTRRYTCNRTASGGSTVRYAATPRSPRKPGRRGPNKKEEQNVNCKCSINIRCYPEGDVLAMYKPEHTGHILEKQNVVYTRLTPGVIGEITRLAQQGMTDKAIVAELDRRHAAAAADPSTPISRELLITIADVHAVRKRAIADASRLDRHDGVSVMLHVAQAVKDSILLFKPTDLVPPPDSELRQDSFCLIWQTPWQKVQLQEFGHDSIWFIDATHNTTRYQNVLLTSILVKDKHGRGVPVAWMVHDEQTEHAFVLLLRLVHLHNPGVIPRYIMSDRDVAQICAILIVFGSYGVRVLLCRWHVLHAWRRHFATDKFPELWALLKTWVRETNDARFWAIWAEIQAMPAHVCPPSILAYLRKEWVEHDYINMWVAWSRDRRSIEDQSDTNMLVEAWHHFLKSHILEGKRNRRLDILYVSLTTVAVPYYEKRYKRQQCGLEGDDQAMVIHKRALKLGASIPASDIAVLAPGHSYAVTSQTARPAVHTVNFAEDGAFCDCDAWSAIDYCKHVAAVELHHRSDLLLVEPTHASTALHTRGDSNDAPAHVQAAARVAREAAIGALAAANDAIRVLIRPLASRLDTYVAPDAQTARRVQSTLELLQQLVGAPLPGVVDTKIAPNQTTSAEFRLTYSGKPPKRKRAKEDTGATHGAHGLPAVKLKPRKADGDPYSGGASSGALAKPDAVRAPRATAKHASPPTPSSSAYVHLPAPLPVPPPPATHPPHDLTLTAPLPHNHHSYPHTPGPASRTRQPPSREYAAGAPSSITPTPAQPAMTSAPWAAPSPRLAPTTYMATPCTPVARTPASYTPGSYAPASFTPAPALHTPVTYAPASGMRASYPLALGMPTSYTPVSCTPAPRTPVSRTEASYAPASYAPASYAPASYTPALCTPASRTPASYAPVLSWTPAPPPANPPWTSAHASWAPGLPRPTHVAPAPSSRATPGPPSALFAMRVPDTLDAFPPTMSAPARALLMPAPMAFVSAASPLLASSTMLPGAPPLPRFSSSNTSFTPSSYLPHDMYTM